METHGRMMETAVNELPLELFADENNVTLDVTTLKYTLSNLTSVAKRETPVFPRYIQVTSTVFYVFIFLLGVLGNLLVTLVVCMNRNMKTSVNIYLVNLCTADLLLLFICMPTALVDVYARDVWYFGEIMCKAVPFLENTVAQTSILTLIAISVERYRVVCQPLRGIQEGHCKSAKVVCVLWIISVLCNIPWLKIAIHKSSRHLDGTPIMVCRIPIRTYWQRAYAAFSFSLHFAIPFALLVILYSRICYILHCTNESSTDLQTVDQRKHRRRLRAQVINIIFSLVLLFFLCHLPFRVISMWLAFGKKEDIHSLGLEKYFNILYFGRIMFYLNHAVNPIIYNFVSTKFRNALKSLIVRRRRSNYNAPFTRPRDNTQALLVDQDMNKNMRNISTSSDRKNRNEFFPMYAHILQNHGTRTTSNGISTAKNGTRIGNKHTSL